MKYKQEIAKLQTKLSNYQNKLLTERKKKAEQIEAVKAETHIKVERHIVPKSRFGKFLHDMILTVEKYI